MVSELYFKEDKLIKLFIIIKIMKHIPLIVLFILYASFTGYAQKDYLPSRILDQPDGITIEFIDFREYDSINQNKPLLIFGIFTGSKLQLRFDMTLKKNGNTETKTYKNISEYKNKLDSLTKLITIDLIDSLNSCCKINKCQDGLSYGYWITIKKRNEYWFAAIDLSNMIPEHCELSQFIEVIRIFDEIIDKTNKD